jgi:beta-aspartyl-dipeptidase (metallo-type)
MVILIENGEVYAPEPQGRRSVLVINEKIMKVGEVDRRALDRLGLEYEVVDAGGGAVVPGLIDPHEHLLGGSGESGFSTQTPEIQLSEIVAAGITTVVGCLGVDTTMKTMAGLLAKAKALREEGLTAYVWSGGYDVPPTTVTNSVRNDLMFIDEVIGAGEIAISDERSTDHDPLELARLVNDTHVGGMLSNKAGVTHFHVGDEPGRLRPLRDLVENFPVKAAWLYPTHVERGEELMREAIELAAQGAFVDVDVMEKDLAKWLRFYRDGGGDMRQLTASSDASTGSPQTLSEQLRGCVREHGFRLEDVLPHVTANTARALKLENKGRVEEGKDADLLVLRRGSLDIAEVVARGRRMVKGGELAVKEKFLAGSNRRVRLEGEGER